MIVKVREVIIGGDYIPIQTMLKNPVTEIEKSIEKINYLSSIGCDIIRITVPDFECTEALKEVVKNSPIPIVADIHFDYRLAIAAVESGVDKVRINPGNIGNEKNVKKLIECLKNHSIPVRIGINKGSLSDYVKSKTNNPVDAMIMSARKELEIFEKNNYKNIVLSFKSSSVIETLEVNKRAKSLFEYPLHIGVTEAGDKFDGTIKNSVGTGILLSQKIGDTIRVSLTASEAEEVECAKKILEALGLRKSDVEIISCPTCGRTEVNISDIVAMLKENFHQKIFNKKLKIAVMGCIVNGPGEASECDFGVACGKGQSIIFREGKKIKTVKNSKIIDELIKESREYYEN